MERARAKPAWGPGPWHGGGGAPIACYPLETSETKRLRSHLAENCSLPSPLSGFRRHQLTGERVEVTVHTPARPGCGDGEAGRLERGARREVREEETLFKDRDGTSQATRPSQMSREAVEGVERGRGREEEVKAATPITRGPSNACRWPVNKSRREPHLAAGARTEESGFTRTQGAPGTGADGEEP